MNSVRSNNLSLKNQRFTPSDCKDIGIRTFEFVAKTQFICKEFFQYVKKETIAKRTAVKIRFIKEMGA